MQNERSGDAAPYVVRSKYHGLGIDAGRNVQVNKQQVASSSKKHRAG